MVLWPPSSSRARSPEASRIIAMRRADIRRMAGKVTGRARNQGRLQRENTQPFFFLAVACSGQRGAKVEQGCSVWEPGNFVAGFGRSHDELFWNRPVSSVQGQGLLRREAPVLAKALFQIDSAKTPERCIPSRALSLHLIRAARDVPALDDRLQKAVRNEALAVGPRQIP